MVVSIRAENLPSLAGNGKYIYIYIYDHKHPTSAYLYAVYVFVFSVLYFSVGNFPIANVGRYPGRKPAATESRYPAVSNFKRSEELPGVT